MTRQTWVTRDAQGNVTGSTEVRSTSGCGGCFWVLLVAFVVVGPAAWAGNGQIPIALAVFMYAIEAVMVVAAAAQYRKRR